MKCSYHHLLTSTEVNRLTTVYELKPFTMKGGGWGKVIKYDLRWIFQWLSVVSTCVPALVVK
jgi:hypothetical protein